MLSPASSIFSAPPQEATFSGLLFDMDGTVIDSTDAVVKHWHRFAFPPNAYVVHFQLLLYPASLHCLVTLNQFCLIITADCFILLKVLVMI
jgi:hypothetical protein